MTNTFTLAFAFLLAPQLRVAFFLPSNHPWLLVGIEYSGSVVNNLPANARDKKDVGLIPGAGRSPGVGNGNPTAVFLPGESHGQGSLVGYIVHRVAKSRT